METNKDFEEQIRELRKNISALEWDIKCINNAEVKTVKEERLKEYKTELSKIMQQLNTAGAYNPRKTRKNKANNA